jgi:hypothetical protein
MYLIVGYDDRNGIAHVTNFIARQDEWSNILTQPLGSQTDQLGHRLAERSTIGRQVGAQIVECIDGANTFQSQCGGFVDLTQCGVRQWTANEGRGESFRQLDVVHEPGSAGEKSRILDPPRTFPT